jgi:hypothetical protein
MGDIIGIFDAATGHPALTLVLRGLSINTLPVWESDDALLVVAHDHDGQEAIVRIGLDGTVTPASRVVQDTLPPEEGLPPPTILQLAATP